MVTRIDCDDCGRRFGSYDPQVSRLCGVCRPVWSSIDWSQQMPARTPEQLQELGRLIAEDAELLQYHRTRTATT